MIVMALCLVEINWALYGLMVILKYSINIISRFDGPAYTQHCLARNRFEFQIGNMVYQIGKLTQ